MLATNASAYVWRIRPLLAEEVVLLLEEHWEVLASAIDWSPTFPLPDAEIRGCLFNIFVEYAEFARQILMTAEPPQEVLDNISPRTAADIAIHILAETRASMPDRFFDALVAFNLRDASKVLNGLRH